MALVPSTALSFVASSFAPNERSASTGGLIPSLDHSHRWIIKGIYVAWLRLGVLGIVSVVARLIVFLFGGRSQQEIKLQIGSTTLDVQAAIGGPCSTGWLTTSP
jgi:hypothetical protein